DARHGDGDFLRQKGSDETSLQGTRDLLGMRGGLDLHSRRTFSARPRLLFLRHRSILPTPRHARARQRRDGRLPGLRRRAEARPPAAVEDSAAGHVQEVSKGFAAHRCLTLKGEKATGAKARVRRELRGWKSDGLPDGAARIPLRYWSP